MCGAPAPVAKDDFIKHHAKRQRASTVCVAHISPDETRGLLARIPRPPIKILVLDDKRAFGRCIDVKEIHPPITVGADLSVQAVVKPTVPDDITTGDVK